MGCYRVDSQRQMFVAFVVLGMHLALTGAHESGPNMAMFAGDTTVDLMYRLLNGAMPLDVDVKKVVIQIGANNILKQWFQVSAQSCCPRSRHLACAMILTPVAVCEVLDFHAYSVTGTLAVSCPHYHR